MSKASQKMQDLSKRLFAIEARRLSPADELGPLTLAVCGKLRVALQAFAGPDGFISLLSRAHALAAIERPQLKTLAAVRSLQSVDEFIGSIGAHDDSRDNANGVEIVAQLLGLLVTFIGEPFTLSLMRDGWPDESFDSPEPSSEVE